MALRPRFQRTRDQNLKKKSDQTTTLHELPAAQQLAAKAISERYDETRGSTLISWRLSG